MKNKIIFTTLLIEKSPQAIPLGAACVASAVKNHKLTSQLCDVELLPFNLEDFDDDFFCGVLKDSLDSKKDVFFRENDEKCEYVANFISAEILKKKPVMTGFSVFVWNCKILQRVSEILRKNKVFTFAGGPEITAHPASFSAFDRTVCGEGESKVPLLVYDFLTGNLTDEKPENQNSALSNDSVFLKSPYLDGTLDPGIYEGALWELARGCPFKCAYCYESKGEKTVRAFPYERIQKELELFAEKKIPQVFVLDPTYNANKQRAISLLKMIKQKTPDTFYYFEARAEFIDRELANTFASIKCALQIGLQTADENVAKLVNRPFNLKTFTKKIGILNDAGVIFGLDVIYGLPGDSFSGFKNTVNYAISLYPNNLEIFCLSVLPGTSLFDDAETLHINFDPFPPYHVLNTDKFSKEDLQKASQIAFACNLFYNEGRAVPWFNIICHALKIKPVIFFEKFYNFLCFTGKVNELKCKKHYNHKELEQLQQLFVKELFCERKISRLLPVAQDLISLHGAISRKTDTNLSETVELHYPVEYLDSRYAFDLEFFIKNVRQKPSRFKT